MFWTLNSRWEGILNADGTTPIVTWQTRWHRGPSHLSGWLISRYNALWRLTNGADVEYTQGSPQAIFAEYMSTINSSRIYKGIKTNWTSMVQIHPCFSSAHHILEDSNCCYTNQLTLVVAEAEAKFRNVSPGSLLRMLQSRRKQRNLVLLRPPMPGAVQSPLA